MFGLASFSRRVLRTLQPKIFSLTSQRRFKKDDLKDRIFPTYASLFRRQDLNALRVSFEPAEKYEVIPNAKVTIPKKYILPKVNHDVLISKDFNVKDLKIEDKRAQTFVAKLHEVVKNSGVEIGTTESKTNDLVNDLLIHVVEMDNWPFRLSISPRFKLFANDESVTAEPEFVINKEDIAILCVEQDKHLKNHSMYPFSGFGEWQLAGEILACGNDNLYRNCVDQEIFALRVISTYVTFYRTTIPTLYWEELSDQLLKEQSVVIKRWPKENGKETGLNLAEPEGRVAVMTDLIRIREHLLK